MVPESSQAINPSSYYITDHPTLSHAAVVAAAAAAAAASSSSSSSSFHPLDLLCLRPKKKKEEEEEEDDRVEIQRGQHARRATRGIINAR